MRNKSQESGSGVNSNGLEGFLGGPWHRVVLKLVIFSVIVGFVMITFGIDPEDLVREFGQTIRRLANAIAFQGLDTVITIARYCAYGAIIVVPVWLISRFFASRRP
jgi:hypothetical protein